MPVATLAEFVAEQAIAITVGVAAIVAAPKAGPKLAELGGDLGAKVKSMTDSTQSDAAAAATASGETTTDNGGGPAGAAAATASLAAAGRSLAEKLSSGAQKLGQQWSALLVETEAETASLEATAPSMADVLAGATAADIVSFAPGRARLRLQALRGQPQLAAQLDEALAAVDGVRHVQANPTTGSVLILFDKDRYPSPDSFLEAISHQ